MKIIETKVYTFEELSPEAKEKAREWYREGNDYPYLEEEMNYKAGELLKKAGIKNADYSVLYSLSYSQGDGAMIKLTADWKAWRVVVKNSGHYSHERSTTIELTSLRTGEYAPVKTVEDFEENVYIPLCIELRDYGYDCIDYEDSDESVDEMLIANDFEFTSEGKQF